jgi:glutamate synthase domain-containing protein 2
MGGCTDTVQRGGDIVKVLCIGAKIISLGKSFLYSSACTMALKERSISSHVSVVTDQGMGSGTDVAVRIRE